MSLLVIGSVDGRAKVATRRELGITPEVSFLPHFFSADKQASVLSLLERGKRRRGRNHARPSSSMGIRARPADSSHS